MEHVVSRADLAGTESSPSPSPDLDAIERFRGLVEFDFITSSASNDRSAAPVEDKDDDGLDFQLFAAPKTGGNAKASETGEPHKIRLSSPLLNSDRFGFVRPHRCQGYYFAEVPSSEEKCKLEIAALEGEQVLARSKSPWPGSAYAWKVLHLPPSGVSKDLRPPDLAKLPRLTGAQETKKRTRPGKKCRLKIRKKSAASQAQKNVKKAAAETKEAAEREKRTRRNREKKVKKKAKEKAKKQGKGEGDGAEGDGSEQGVEAAD